MSQEPKEEELYMGEEGEDLASVCMLAFVHNHPELFNDPEEDAIWEAWGVCPKEGNGN